MLLLPKPTKRRKRPLFLHLDTEQQALHTKISSGCMLALMAASASMAMAAMNKVCMPFPSVCTPITWQDLTADCDFQFTCLSVEGIMHIVGTYNKHRLISREMRMFC